MVNVATSIEFEGTLQGNSTRDVTGNHGRVDLFDSRIQVGDIGIVVFGVMDFHGFGRNVG
jgi:hypothetical protein